MAKIQIAVKRETKEILDRLRQPGQTYDGVIRVLLKRAGEIKGGSDELQPDKRDC